LFLLPSQIIGCTVDVQNPAAVDMVPVARPTGLLDSVHQLQI